MRPFHQFFRLRGCALEAEIGEAMEFGVGGRSALMGMRHVTTVHKYSFTAN
jgi:hypothetical protein